MWHFEEQGEGRPLILLHGIGMSSTAWKPVMPLLAESRRVIAFDTAGFGKTPPLRNGITPTMPHLVNALRDNLHQLGITEPVDMAGNSMGGYMALEAAKCGLARTVVALSPAGLWQHSTAPHIKHVFGSMRFCARHFPAMTRRAMASPLIREVALAVPLGSGARRLSPDDALRAAQEFANATGFDETFAHTSAFRGGQHIDIPLTVAFGTRDWLITRSAQRRDELPAHTRWLNPRGWGHVPMWQDPAGVTHVILDGIR